MNKNCVAALRFRAAIYFRLVPNRRADFFQKEITVFFGRRESHKIVRKIVTALRAFEYPHGTNLAGSGEETLEFK
jgi:hypothetical protein